MPTRAALIAAGTLLAFSLATSPGLHAADAPAKGAKSLGLTDAQKSELAAIKRRHRTTVIEPLVAERKRMLADLKELIKRKAGDTETKAKIAEIQGNAAAFQEAGRRHRGEIAAILTPAQQAQLAVWLHQPPKKNP